MGPPRRRHRGRLQAVLRRTRRQAEAPARAQGSTERRVRSHAGHRPRPRGRVDQLASAPSAEAESARQADRLSRNHQEGDRSGRQGRARCRRQSRPRAGKPTHPGPAIRLHAVARAVEESTNRPERGPRSERRRSHHRGSGRRAACVPIGAVLGPRGAILRGGPHIRRHADAPR